MKSDLRFSVRKPEKVENLRRVIETKYVRKSCPTCRRIAQKVTHAKPQASDTKF